ncbi:MAG: bifunctional riboflavin kinase/FAD synthetase [Sphingomonas sp.]|nr:bifunctional riboflavin kinase/FAD synthetase [Sphingomonas sp.]
MQRLSLAGGIPESLKGSIVALGNFDGFHLGHQAVVGRAVQRGFHERRPVVVATFDPHPVRLFKPDSEPFRLTSLDQREALFANAGADAMLVFEFDRALAATSAEDFVARLVVGTIGASGIVTGDDFTFGKGRAGDVGRLADLAAVHGVIVEAVHPICASDERVSSGRIREALSAGDMATATRLLTRPFAVRGMVEPGDKRGRELGYPTANLALGDYQRPRFGVYAVRVRLDDGSEHDGVANLGFRPMFDPPEELLEAHIFGFDGDLYGRMIEVDLIAFLRDEMKFDSLTALTGQMRKDEAEARRILSA